MRPPTATSPETSAQATGGSSAYSNPFLTTQLEDTIVDSASRSTRPAAISWDPTATEDQPSIAETFNALLNDVDASFGSIEMRKGDSERPGGKHVGHLASSSLDDVRELFAQLASSHMRQVRDFMIDVKWGEATRDWVGVCEPAVRSLRRAAEKLDLQELCGALDEYHSALEAAASVTDRAVTGDPKQQLITTYEKLLALMPQAFALETDRVERESVIVQSLLLQVPDVRKVTIDKLYAAGLTSLEVIFAATPDDVSMTTGIPMPLAERIVERFQRYRHELQNVVPDAARSAERDRLGALLKALRAAHAEYDRLGDAWSDEDTARKRHLRQARDAALLEAKVILARLGEVQRLATIDRLTFERKIAEIETFLEEAVDRYAPS